MNKFHILALIGLIFGIGHIAISSADASKVFDPVTAAQQSYEFTVKEYTRADIAVKETWEKHRNNEVWVREAGEHMHIAKCNLAMTKIVAGGCLVNKAVYGECGVPEPAACKPDNKPQFNNNEPAVKMSPPMKQAGDGMSIAQLLGQYTTR